MSDTILCRIATLSIELERAQSKDTLRAHLTHATSIFGTDNYLLGVRGALKATGEPKQLALTNFPQQWQKIYDEEKLSRVNPYLRRALSARGPFRWDEVETTPDEEAYKARMAQFGMVHGMVSTSVTLDGYMGMLIFNGRKSIPKPQWPDTKTALHLFSCASTRALANIVEQANPALASTGPQVVLSGEERQCLELTAQGFIARDVGEQLNITARTVRYHLDRVAAKLNVRNKSEAVAEALSRGLIRKRHFGDPQFKGSVV